MSRIFIWHTDLTITRIFKHEIFWTRIERIGRIIFARGSCSVFYMHTDLYLLIAHGSHGSHGSCSRRGAHGFWTLEFSEHEIRRRPTDRREVIKRIARIVFARGSYSVFNTHTDFTLFFICTRISRIARIFVRGETLTGGLNTIFLNTNNQNDTNNFLHADFTLFFIRTRIARTLFAAGRSRGAWTRDFWTRIIRITRMFFGTRISLSRIFYNRIFWTREYKTLVNRNDGSD